MSLKTLSLTNLCCLIPYCRHFLVAVPVAFRPFSSHPPPPPAPLKTPQCLHHKWQPPKSPQGLHNCPKWPYSVFLCYSECGGFWRLYWPLAAIHYHPRPLATFLYLGLLPPHAPPPQISPMATQRGV